MGQDNVPNYPRFIDDYSDTKDKRNNALIRASFSKVLASSWDDPWDLIGPLGSGQAVSQASGTGLMTSGTTANAETIMRLKRTFSGAFAMRARVTLSQRIAQNNFFLELVDVLGDHLAFTVLSATTVQVTLPDTFPFAFTPANVGQSITLGKVQGTAIIPGRYPIAAVDGTGKKLTFTVTSGPSSGSGTVCLFGWNFHRTLFDGTTATNAKYDTGRRGWATGDTTTTIATSASPTVMGMVAEDGTGGQLNTTQNSTAWTQVGTRTDNIPDNDVDLVLQVRMLNGTTNPASTTTFTLGFVAIETADPIVARIGSQPGFGGGTQISLAPFQTVDIARVNGGTVATNNGTASAQAQRVCIASDNTAFPISQISTSVTPGTAAANLGKAEDAVAASGDTGIMPLGVRRDALTTSASAAGDYNEMATDRFGAQLVRSFEKHARTYRAASNFTPAATPTDVWDLFGNATTTVIVTKIKITGIQTTAGNPEVLVVKRSTANTVGTRVAQTAVPLDAGDAAASSTPGHYTANPTTGSLVGAVAREYVQIPAAASLIQGGMEFNFGDKGKGLLLSGTAQGVAVNLNGVTLTGGQLSIEVEWYEF